MAGNFRSFIGLFFRQATGWKVDMTSDRGNNVTNAVSNLNITFFSAADPHMRRIISYNEFQKSLLLNVLFHRNIRLHEAYYFNSVYLIDHIRHSNCPSLFELASSSGIVLPAFRDGNAAALDKVFERCRQLYGP